MIMKKTTQDSLLLSFFLILLCLPSHQVRAVDTTLPPLAAAVPPSQFLHLTRPPVATATPATHSRPCGSNIGSHVTALGETRCRQIPRPPKTQNKKIPRPRAAIP